MQNRKIWFCVRLALSLHGKHKTEAMKRLLFFLTVATLVSCGRSFEKCTAKYAEVGEVSDNRAAVLDINEGVGRWAMSMERGGWRSNAAMPTPADLPTDWPRCRSPKELGDISTPWDGS